MFPVSPEIVKIPKNETFNRILRKFREERQIEQKVPVRSLQTFRWPRKVVIFSAKVVPFVWKFPDKFFKPGFQFLRVENAREEIKSPHTSLAYFRVTIVRAYRR